MECIRQEYAEIAKDLGYKHEVIEKILEAKSEAEIERIMVTARHNM